MTPPRRRCLALGLDGLSKPLAERLCELAPLPALSRLVADARTRTVDSELPELSPVNWTSFFTAVGPETHGVYGFTSLDPASYALRLTDFDQVAAPTIFARLGEKGLTVKVLNLPNTYPARPVPGLLVAGFIAPELSRAVHPPVMAQVLFRAGYRLEADTSRGARDPDFLLAELRASLASRRKAFDLFFPDLAFDLFVLVLTETDRLFHFLLGALLEPLHPLHGPCMAFLAEWDRLLGDILAAFTHLPEPKRLLVFADHGFTATRMEVDVNSWLARHGYLALQGRPGGENEATRIAPATAAFALDPGRIYLHQAGRFARGSLSLAASPRLKEDLRAGLRALTFEGEPVMEEVLDGATLYPGASGAQVPDLVCLARPGFDLKAKFDGRELFGLHGRSGCHTARGAIFHDSAGAAPARLRDVGREVLAYFEA